MKKKVITIATALAGFSIVAARYTYFVEEDPFSSIRLFEPKSSMTVDSRQEGQMLSFSPANKTMYVNTNAAIVREQPNDEAGIIFSLDYSDFILVTGDNSNNSYGWIQIDVNGVCGYINSEYLSENMLFFDDETKMFVNQNFSLEDGTAFLRNTEVCKIGYNKDFSKVMIDNQSYIIPNEMLSDEFQPDPAVSINYNYISNDRYIPVVEKAYSLLNTPYGHGCTESLTDCVGLTMMCYSEVGISLPWSLQQAYSGTSVNYNDAVPGDIIIWAPLGSSQVSHVGLYIGEGKMIHASSTKGVIVADVSNYVRYGGNMIDVRHIEV